MDEKRGRCPRNKTNKQRAEQVLGQLVAGKGPESGGVQVSLVTGDTRTEIVVASYSCLYTRLTVDITWLPITTPHSQDCMDATWDDHKPPQIC
jgi:hypothetical protein